MLEQFKAKYDEARNEAKAALEAALPGKEAAAEAAKGVRVLIRKARWAAVDIVWHMPADIEARTEAASYYGRHLAEIDANVKDAAKDVYAQRMRMACVTYAKALEGADREKADPLSLAIKAHDKAKADETKQKIEEAHGDEAMEMTADDLGLPVLKLARMLANGDLTARERYDAFLGAIAGRDQYIGAVTQGWRVASPQVKSEAARFMVATCDEKLLQSFEWAIQQRREKLAAEAKEAEAAERALLANAASKAEVIAAAKAKAA